MPPKNKKSDDRALAPVNSTRAHTRKAGDGKRRAKRTADMSGGSAPRIMRRPKPRRRTQQVTAQFGAITPGTRKRKVGITPFAKKKKKVQTVKIRGGKLPWTAILTALCCTVVIMTLVINYVRLNELTNEYRALQGEILGLASDKKSLEQQKDVLEYKEQAEKYGMVASDRVEKRYIRLQNEDKIVVYEEDGNAFTRFFSDLWQDVGSFFANIFG